MADVPAAPFLMSDVSVKIGADTYEEALSICRFVPTTPKAMFKGLGGNVHKFVGTPSWVANWTFAQDTKSAQSLHKLLNATAPGTPLAVELVAQDGGDVIAATILAEPTDIGGELDTVPTAAVALDVDGQVTRTTPEPTP